MPKPTASSMHCVNTMRSQWPLQFSLTVQMCSSPAARGDSDRRWRWQDEDFETSLQEALQQSSDDSATCTAQVSVLPMACLWH